MSVESYGETPQLVQLESLCRLVRCFEIFFRVATEYGAQGALSIRWARSEENITTARASIDDKVEKGF